jgi:NodT family efflux transporter outer membrane factor (OMF) lipoprotein
MLCRMVCALLRRIRCTLPGRRAGQGLLLLCLCGCTTLSEYVHNGFKVGPNYRKPLAPVADDWIDAADVRVRKESDDLCHWWAVFNDPVLDALIQTAYGQNLTLREAGFRVLQARAELGIAIGEFFPQLQTLTGSWRRQELSRNAPNRQFLGERIFNQWTTGFNLAWEVDFWGRYRRAIESAEALLDASVEDYDAVLVMLLGDVASTYVQVRTLEQEIEYVKTNIGLQRETLKIAQARFQGGQATELDVDQAQSTLSQTESQVPQLEIQLRQANNRLCVLLGIPPEELRAKLGPAGIPAAPPEVAVGIPAELLVRRPDVRRAERQAAAESARIGIAEADLYPRISIVGNLGLQAQDFQNLFEGQSFFGQIGPSFSWNILNYGRIVNNSRVQDARFLEAVTRYQNAVLRAGEEVENGLVQFLRAQEEARFLAESGRAAEKAVKVALAQYKGGLVDFNRVSLLEQNLVQQQNLLAQARGAIALGLIQTYRALGGGWQIRCSPCPPLPAGPPPAEILPPPRSFDEERPTATEADGEARLP